MIHRTAVRALVALALGACSAPGAETAGQTPAAAPAAAGVRLYVANQNGASVSIVDGATGALLETVDLTTLGFSANAKPHHALPEPDGSAWYVSLIGDNQVVKLDRANRVVARAPLETPGMLTLDHRRGMLYASRSMTAVNAPSSVGIFRTRDMALVDETDVIVPRPHAIAADTVTGRVYVAGLGDNRIAVIDTAGRVALAEVPGPNHVYVTFALSPDGRTLAASTQLTSKLLGFDVSTPGSVRQIAEVDVLPFGYQIAYAPDGRAVWLGNQRSDAATQVETPASGAWRVAGVVRHAAFQEPHGVAVSPDGRTVFVSSHGRADTTHTAHQPVQVSDTAHGGMHADRGVRGAGTVVVLDARTRVVKEVVPVGPYGAGVGIGGGR